MSRQDKATTDRHARILRDLVKQPDNKACADCRKNDARWASWNLGVYLCIRCSGIHRSMGTHISKVKSIDLDMWTPEQMEKWGNRRANLYWEKHLKAGHVPPEHKIESFIRSKYESRRWAMEGPPPSDPSVLENGPGYSQPAPAETSSRPTPTSTAPPPAAAGRSVHPLLSRTAAPPKATSAPAPAAAPLLDLMGGDEPTPAPAPAAAAAAPTAAPTQALAEPTQATTASAAPGPTPSAPKPSNIFDLDFRAPTPQAQKPQTAKADIMSLFSTPSPSTAHPTQSFFSPPPPVQAQNAYASWGGGVTSSAPPVQQQHNQAPIGGGWGGMQADQNAWGAPTQPQPQQSAPTSYQSQYQQQTQQQQQQPPQSMQLGNVWGATSDPWAFGANAGASNGGGLGGLGGFGQPQKKEEVDPFANIWK